MDSHTIETLRRDANRHREIAKRIDAFIDELLALEAGNQSLALNGSDLFEATAEAAETKKRFEDMTQLEAVRVILKESKGAKTRDIFRALNRGGKRIARASYVTAILSKHNEFYRDENGDWQLMPF